MKEYNFYEYNYPHDKIKIYSDDIHNYFEGYNIFIDSVDFDENQNVILYIEDLRLDIDKSKLEKTLLSEIEHLNDVEIRNMKIVLTFDCKEIVLA